jgi:predicted transport protein
MPLYRLNDSKLFQVKQTTFEKEKNIQSIVETNSLMLLGVRLIKSEFVIGGHQRGRIDSLGLDHENNPTIIEYKLSNNQNVINQGLFYLDWLFDHKGDFEIAAQKALGPSVEISWTRPRLILIAESFFEYDKYAVNRIGGNIELWTYRKYGEDLLYLEPLYVSYKGKLPEVESESPTEGEEPQTYSIEGHFRGKSENLKKIFSLIQENILGLAEENKILEKAAKIYIAYSHGKNFCEIKPLQKELVIWLDLPINEIDDPYHLLKDVSKIGHHGTGDVEVRISEISDFNKVFELIKQSFNATV